MKISNSKKQLAKIIHENGGWRDGYVFSAQDGDDRAVWFYEYGPVRGSGTWWKSYGRAHRGIEGVGKLPNWHQTILSRDEYFHLYPAPVEVVVENKTACHLTVTDKPTVEQLAAEYRNRKDFADRKQQEADAAKADAEAKLAELVAAGKALGLAVSVAEAEPELSINDWQDLQVGDIIECIGNWEREDTDGQQFVVTRIDPRNFLGRPIRIEVPGVPCPGTWGKDFKFIRRPAKGGANA